jgi:hypothetical protein
MQSYRVFAGYDLAMQDWPAVKTLGYAQVHTFRIFCTS